jgi:ferredoxin
MIGFRLHLDATRCDGHGICAFVCPDLVRLDPWGYASVAQTDGEGAGLMRRARRAVAMCPAAALALELLE